MIDLLDQPVAAEAGGDQVVDRRSEDRWTEVIGQDGDPRRAAFIASLRARYAVAEQRRDADAKQALFKEAAYLGIRPEAYQG
ncbi:hypothetical protein [Synechococcus sp. CCY 9618]|uniref:hypothetical protein n=1 Tax=Synechococcus sp. CCY 9618 TaxID=2815602 RepID=UPI0020B1C5B4|nr:hypothetical protein [Synechococcus sp. CCY 9618]